MDSLSFKTLFINHKNILNKKWYIVDATNHIAGRLASKLANLIRGKNKVYFSPHINCGDNIIVLNSSKIIFKGKKFDQKKYIKYTGYPGGKKEIPLKQIFNKNPNKVLEIAIKGMLPKNKLSRIILKNNLYIYKDCNHKHHSQKPKIINI